MREGRSLVDLARELDRQRHAKEDLLVSSALIHHETGAGGSSEIAIEDNETLRRYGITDVARRQLAEKLNIPFKYFERMRAEQPELLDSNVNTWLQSDSSKRMLRTMDGKVRAVLSDRYRRLDNFALAEHVLPIFQGIDGGRVESVELTETRMYLKFVHGRLSHTMKPGDVVQAGVVISNSEIGLGSLAVQPLLYRLVCENGLIVPEHSLRRTHIGRTLANEEDGVQLFQDDTLQADDLAFFLKVRDMVQAALSEATFRHFASSMQRTMGIPITGDPVKSVEVLSKRFSLSEDERGGVLRHLINGGELSAYGLVNAVTRFSQDVENYDRATDLETVGGHLIAMNDSEWEVLAKAG